MRSACQRLQDFGRCCSIACNFWGRMRPIERERSATEDLFRLRLDTLIDLRHELVKLAKLIAWQQLVAAFGPLYVETKGRPGVPVRLMVALHYLEYSFDLSDEQVTARWVENPYWQYFRGEEYFQHAAPIDPSQMTRFRRGIGQAGCDLMLKLTVEAGLKSAALKRQSLARVAVDTTVQKAIAFLTDAKLYKKSPHFTGTANAACRHCVAAKLCAAG
jgi:IS5 family transposase